jgi:hypothetical protein
LLSECYVLTDGGWKDDFLIIFLYCFIWQDAVWMTGSLRCETVGDVLLLLKSSDFVLHDLTQA